MTQEKHLRRDLSLMPYLHPGALAGGLTCQHQDLADEYETGDPRMAATIFKGGDTYFNGTPFDPTTSITGYAVKKFLGNFNPVDDGAYDYVYIRYGDVLLWKAECYAQLDNPDAREDRA